MKRLWDIQGRLRSDCWAHLLLGNHHALRHPVCWDILQKAGRPTAPARVSGEETVGQAVPLPHRGPLVLSRRDCMRSMTVAGSLNHSSDDSAGTACRRPVIAETLWSVERLGFNAFGTPSHSQLLTASYRTEARRAVLDAVAGPMGGSEIAISSVLLSSRGGGGGTSSNHRELDFAEVYLPRRSRQGPSETLDLNQGEGAPASSGVLTGGDGALHGKTPSATNKKPRSARRQREMPPLLSATDAAVAHIKEIVNSYNERLQLEEASGAVRRPRACGIRVSLKKQGCSGMAYDVAICTEGPPNGSSPSSTPIEGAVSDKVGGSVTGSPTGTSRRSKNWREDEVVKVGEVEIRVAADAVMMLVGTQVDFVDEEVQTGFVFNNPNQKQSCGCGKSFMV